MLTVDKYLLFAEKSHKHWSKSEDRCGACADAIKLSKKSSAKEIH